MSNEQHLPINSETITLSQFLKAANLIGSGGEAKLYLAEFAVVVNGESENRRGRKLRVGDVVVAPGEPPYRLIEGDPNAENDEDDAA